VEQDLNTRWKLLSQKLEASFQKRLNLEGIIFLIGLRELGAGPGQYSKEEKVDLMHIAICRLLSRSGYYRLSHRDQDGWPHWELLKPLPHADIISQVALLREHILLYFEEEGLFE
jgi:hypothetical protein